MEGEGDRPPPPMIIPDDMNKRFSQLCNTTVVVDDYDNVNKVQHFSKPTSSSSSNEERIYNLDCDDDRFELAMSDVRWANYFESQPQGTFRRDCGRMRRIPTHAQASNTREEIVDKELQKLYLEEALAFRKAIENKTLESEEYMAYARHIRELMYEHVLKGEGVGNSNRVKPLIYKNPRKAARNLPTHAQGAQGEQVKETAYDAQFSYGSRDIGVGSWTSKAETHSSYA